MAYVIVILEKIMMKNKKQYSKDRRPIDAIKSPSTRASLKRLRALNHGLYTSSGNNYNNAVFGRDSIISARELLSSNPEISREVILTIASLQGTKYRKISSEEPGKIHHENRDFRTWRASFLKKSMMPLISLLWGGNARYMTTYFTADATPMYLSLVAEYAQINPSILDENVKRNNDKIITIRQSVIEAVEYITRNIANNGLVRTIRTNPFSLVNCTWKDSPTSYIHENGRVANFTKPMYYLQVQVFAVDGLRQASSLLESSDPTRANKYRETADALAIQTIKRFWIEDKNFFSSFIDEPRRRVYKKSRVSQSDPFWMLNSTIFDGVDEQKQEKYIGSIVSAIFSKDFLTSAGIRCRSLSAVDDYTGGDYHGSLVSWPIDTYMTAKGLKRRGMVELGEQLEARVINCTNIAADYYEFFFVLQDGGIVMNPEDKFHKNPKFPKLPVFMFPDSDIAWSVVSAYIIKHGQDEHKTKYKEPSKWESTLEKRIMSDISQVEAYTTNKQVSDNRHVEPEYRLSQGLGIYRTVSKVIHDSTFNFFDNLNKK